MEKIKLRLEKVFDKVDCSLTGVFIIKVTHKDKSKVFEYTKGAYDSTIKNYNDHAIKQFVRGISVDCIDEFMEG